MKYLISGNFMGVGNFDSFGRSDKASGTDVPNVTVVTVHIAVNLKSLLLNI